MSRHEKRYISEEMSPYINITRINIRCPFYIHYQICWSNWIDQCLMLSYNIQMGSLLIHCPTLLFVYNCPSLYPCSYTTKTKRFAILNSSPQKCGSRIKFATAELTRRRNESCLQQSCKESADRKRLNVCHTNGLMSIIHFVSVLPWLRSRYW